MASRESTDGKRQLKRQSTLLYAGAEDYASWYNEGFDRKYSALIRKGVGEGAEAAWMELWTSVILEFTENHGAMDDNEIKVLLALFRMWILERYWIEKDKHGKLIEIAKAVRDCDGEFVSDEPKLGKMDEADDRKEDDGELAWDDEKKVYRERVEATDGKTYVLEYTDPVEKKQSIEEVKTALRTGKRIGAKCILPL